MKPFEERLFEMEQNGKLIGWLWNNWSEAFKTRTSSGRLQFEADTESRERNQQSNNQTARKKWETRWKGKPSSLSEARSQLGGSDGSNWPWRGWRTIWIWCTHFPPSFLRKTALPSFYVLRFYGSNWGWRTIWIWCWHTLSSHVFYAKPRINYIGDKMRHEEMAQGFFLQTKIQHLWWRPKHFKKQCWG